MSRDYSKFDTEAYLSSYCTGMNEFGDNPRFPISKVWKKTAEMFASDVEGETLLDLGSGPTIHNIINAAPHFKSIYLSDFVDTNINMLAKWLNRECPHDFSVLIKKIMEMETPKSDDDPEKREEDMRSKVKGILFCDVTKDNPFQPSIFPQFDAIVSSLTLEAVATDANNYKEIAGRVVSLLKPGGWIVMVVCLKETFYTVGEVKYASACLTEKDVITTWEEVGIKICDSDEIKKPQEAPKDISDESAMFLLKGKKK